MSVDFDSDAVRYLKSQLQPRQFMREHVRKRIYSEIRSQRLAEARELGSHTCDEWNALLKSVDSRCCRCGCYPKPRPCKDHIRPVSRGGSDHIKNLQPLCRQCNTMQGASEFNWLAYRIQNGFGGCSH